MSFFNTTLTNGIQDVSAILPLLGTEQVERHIVSALTGGYLYAAASPISLFGSLGAAKIAFTIAIACTVIRRFPDRSWIGAKWLADAGLSTTGDIAYRIGSPEAHLQLTSIDKSYIDNVDKLRVRFKPGFIRWNIYLVSLSLIFAAIGNTPYIYLLQHSKKSPDLIPLWVYPLIRTLGTALVVTCPQLMIQLRLLQIVRSRIIFLSLRKLYDTTEKDEDGDPTEQQELEREFFDELSEGETAEDWVYRLRAKLLQADDASHDLREALDDQEKRHDVSPYTTTFLFILGILILIGSISTVIGYVGSFTVVQSADNSVGPLIWLGTEGGLSLLRILIWGSNPTFDDHEGLEFILDVPPDTPPSIICTNDEDNIKRDKQLPLKHSNFFLQSIDPYLRPVEPFAHDGVSVFYTLAASAPFEKSALILYVTIHNYKEENSNVIVKFSDLSKGKWIYFKGLAIENGHIKMDAQIRAKDNILTRNTTFLERLRNHCQEIADQLKRSHSRSTQILSSSDLESRGTPAANLASDNYNLSTDWSLVLKRSKIKENATDLGVLTPNPFDVIYLTHGPSETDTKSLYRQFGWWNEEHMAIMRNELLEERPKADKLLLGDRLERDEIDHLLVYESLAIESALARQVVSHERFLSDERRSTIGRILDSTELGSAHEKELLERALKAQSTLDSDNRLQVAKDASYSRLSQYFASAVNQTPDGSHFAYDAGTNPTEHWRTRNDGIWTAAVKGSLDEYTSELESHFEKILAKLRPQETGTLHPDQMSPEAKRNYANLAMAKARCLARHQAMHDRRKIERERSEGLKRVKAQIFSEEVVKNGTEEEAHKRIKTVVRIMRSKYTKGLRITKDLIEQAGSLDMLLSIIEYSEVVTVIDAPAELVLKPEEDAKIYNVADRMLNMMCCFEWTINPHRGVGSNMPTVSYNMVWVSDLHRPGNPYLILWKPGVSCCTFHFTATSGLPGESRKKVLLLSHGVSVSDTARGKIWIVLESPDEDGAYGVREPIFRRLYSEDITSRGLAKQYVEMDVISGQSYRLTIQMHEDTDRHYLFDSPELVDAEDAYQWCEEHPMLLEDEDADKEEKGAESGKGAESEEGAESEAESEEEAEKEGEAESEGVVEKLRENDGMDKERDEAEVKDVGKKEDATEKEDAAEKGDEGKAGAGNEEGTATDTQVIELTSV